MVQRDPGASGNTVITIPANITANGTTGADTANFSGGLSNPISILTGSFGSVASLKSAATAGELPDRNVLRSVVQPALPMRDRLSIGDTSQGAVQTIPIADVTWGVRYEKKKSLSLGSVNTTDSEKTVQNLLRFYPSFHTSLQNPWVGDNHGTSNVGGCVLDADLFNRNMFTLEKIAVITGSSNPNRSDLLPSINEWPAARYFRSGDLPARLTTTTPGAPGSTDKVRFVDPVVDCADDSSRHYLKFSLPMMGGFDGLNVFDQESKKMSDVSIFRERLDSSILQKNASSTSAYRKAIEILSEKSETDMSLFAIPGIRHKSVTDEAMAAADENFGCVYVSDVELYTNGSYITGALGPVDTLDFGTTITSFRNRLVNNSFSVAYLPDVTIDFQASQNPGGLGDLNSPAEPKKVPASVAAIGAIARSDSNFGPQSAPMGFSRGKIIDSKDVDIDFSDSEVSELIENNINPILDVTSPPGSPDGMTIVSQVTMTDESSELKKLGVRRMLIFVRRAVRNIARGILFEPKDQPISSLFRVRVGQFLANAQNSGLISDFEIVIAPDISRLPVSNDILVNANKFKPFGNLENRTNDEQERRTVRGSIFITPVETDAKIEIDINESTE